MRIWETLDPRCSLREMRENGHRQTNAESEIRKLCAGCAAAFNFETGFIDDGLVVGRKGSCRVTLTVHGVAAHAEMIRSAEETRFWRWRIRSSRSRNFMTLNMDFCECRCDPGRNGCKTQWLRPVRLESISATTALSALRKHFRRSKDCGDENCPGHDGRCDLDEAEYGNAGIGEKSGAFPPCPGGGRHDRLRKAADKESRRMVRFLPGCGGRRSGSLRHGRQGREITWFNQYHEKVLPNCLNPELNNEERGVVKRSVTSPLKR